MTDPLMGGVHATGDTEMRVDIEKNEAQVGLVLIFPPTEKTRERVCFVILTWICPQKEMVSGMHRSKSKHELKLLEKIPENAEATVVLVGES